MAVPPWWLLHHLWKWQLGLLSETSYVGYWKSYKVLKSTQVLEFLLLIFFLRPISLCLEIFWSLLEKAPRLYFGPFPNPTELGVYFFSQSCSIWTSSSRKCILLDMQSILLNTIIVFTINYKREMELTLLLSVGFIAFLLI